MEQIDTNIKENSDFCALENEKFQQQIHELEQRLTTLKEEDLPEAIGTTWLDYKKGVVDLELYKN